MLIGLRWKCEIVSLGFAVEYLSTERGEDVLETFEEAG